MRRSTIIEFDKHGEKLISHVSLMKFRFMNLCIKAEPVALLPIQVFIENEVKKIEECSSIGKNDDYHFMILPKYDEDMQAICQAIMRAHPEFIQEIKNMRIDSLDENFNHKNVDVRYLQLTMPEVNDNRYDALKEAAKLAYDDCKIQMDAANAIAKPKFAEMALLESEADQQLLQKELEKQKKQWDEQRDKLYKTKVDEIEDAHNHWLAKQNEYDKELEESENAHGEEVAHSMKMNPKDEE